MLRQLVPAFALCIGLGLFAPIANACPMADAQSASTGEIPKNATVATYTVEGMTCGSCALKIRTAIEETAGVAMVLVHMDGTMQVAFNAKVTSAEAILAIARKLDGYTIKPAEPKKA